MVINNVILLNSTVPVNITIKGKYISTVSSNETGLLADDFQINFHDAFAFPGLINSHDHLDFNCFPILSKKTHNNYTEWGRHIHETYPNEIKEVLKIPRQLRAAWGMYKNLLAGVTTVVNHGTVLKFTDPLITIRQDFQSLHSVKFQKFWKWKLNNPFARKKICVIHIGEGTDVQSSEEIDELLKWNLWNRKLIGIHAVAMNPQQAKKFIGLVWCPVSNRVLLNKDADMARLKDCTRLVFGTDSTLTGNWNAWHHLRLARTTKMASDAELFEMVTRSAAKLWNSPNGAIRHGKKADIVIARKKTGNPTWDDFFETDPEDILMVMHKGNIRLIDSEYFQQLKQGNYDTSNFYPVTINGVTKFVEGDLPALIAKIKKHYPKAVFPCNVYE